MKLIKKERNKLDKNWQNVNWEVKKIKNKMRKNKMINCEKNRGQNSGTFAWNIYLKKLNNSVPEVKTRS